MLVLTFAYLADSLKLETAMAFCCWATVGPRRKLAMLAEICCLATALDALSCTVVCAALAFGGFADRASQT